MNKMSLANGVIADYPGQLNIRDLAAGEGLGMLGAPSPVSADPIFEAVAADPAFTVLADLELTGQVDAAGLGLLADPAAPGEVRIRVPLDPDQGALVLSECDGLLRWELPAEFEPAPTLLDAGSAQRLAVFSDRYRPVPAPPDAAGGLLLGAETLLKPLRKLVLRFAARKTAETVSTFLERDLKEGPRYLARGPDGHWAWRPIASLARLPPGGGTRRVLLCVHGTFSSSEGSFGGLCAPANAAAFLDPVGSRYDAIIGFDHRTLRSAVPENAAALAAALAELPGDEVHLDAIAFSRGALVLRWLTEVMAALPARLHLARVVFVGCTNNGTLLADPAYWRDLVNLYTNLVAGAARFAALAGGPAAGVTAGRVSAALRGLLSFVSLLASEGVDGNAVPGLASMAPGGEVVARLNDPAAVTPEAPPLNYLCEANFDHRLFSDTELTARGLPRSLFLEFADNLVDRLFKHAGNDLVVDRDSMSHLAPWVTPAAIGGRRRFEKDDGVYHTVYFDDPRVAAQLAAWLG